MKPSLRVQLGTLLILFVAGCSPAPTTPTAVAPSATTAAPSGIPVTPVSPTPPAVTPTAPPRPPVPAFQHIVIIVFENKEFGTVIENPQMPYFNELAKSYTLLTQYYAVTHPSLPNYLAMISGNTFDLTFDCYKCSYDAQSLPDLIEASGRSWKTYQEDMPSACFLGDEAGYYAKKHNPFVYFKPIVLDQARCTRSIVPLGDLAGDVLTGALPNFVFVTPNECNDAHDCELDVTDNWLKTFLPPLKATLDIEGQPYLIVLTWDEGQGKHSCCGLPQEAGGRIATVLISPQAKEGFEDSTPYTGYSLPKTIAESWNLAYLGHAADPQNVLITAPWK